MYKLALVIFKNGVVSAIDELIIQDNHLAVILSSH